MPTCRRHETSLGPSRSELNEEKAPPRWKTSSATSMTILRRHDLSPGDSQLHDQGGGFTPGMTEKDTRPDQERVGQRSGQQRGSIAMARLDAPQCKSQSHHVRDNNLLTGQMLGSLRLLMFWQGGRRDGLIDKIAAVETAQRAYTAVSRYRISSSGLCDWQVNNSAPLAP